MTGMQALATILCPRIDPIKILGGGDEEGKFGRSAQGSISGVAGTKGSSLQALEQKYTAGAVRPQGPQTTTAEDGTQTKSWATRSERHL